MAAIKGFSGVEWEVNTASKAGRVELYDIYGNKLTKKSGAAVSELNDEGMIFAGRNDGVIRHARMDRIGGQALALCTPLFSDFFEGANINVSRWSATATTMTATQTVAVGVGLNAGNSVASAVGYMAKTLQTFQRQARAILHAKFRFRADHYTGAVMEAGFGDATTMNGAHANGAYLNITSAGIVQLVWVYNSTPVTTDFGSIGAEFISGVYYTCDIILDDDQITGIIQNTDTGLFIAEKSITLPTSAPKHWAITRIPAFFRQYHTSAPATAPKFFMTHFDVNAMDANLNVPYAQQQARQGLGSPFNPQAGGSPINYANSAAPASATLSNTAAGYATLGGLFQFAAVAGAATDYALFAYQVLSPFQFHCTGVDIETWDTGAAVATTPTLLAWSLGVDQSAISLATASISRVPLGAQSFPVAAPIGAKAERISRAFSTPLVTNPGRYATVILRMPVGTATASQILQGMVTLHGFFS